MRELGRLPSKTTVFVVLKPGANEMFDVCDLRIRSSRTVSKENKSLAINSPTAKPSRPAELNTTLSLQGNVSDLMAKARATARLRPVKT